MVTRVQKWGNSQGLRVGKEILERAHISVGDMVDLAVEKGSIVIRPVVQVRGKLSLTELVSRMPKDYAPGKEVWGRRSGREVW